MGRRRAEVWLEDGGPLRWRPGREGSSGGRGSRRPGGGRRGLRDHGEALPLQLPAASAKHEHRPGSTLQPPRGRRSPHSRNGTAPGPTLPRARPACVLRDGGPSPPSLLSRLHVGCSGLRDRELLPPQGYLPEAQILGRTRGGTLPLTAHCGCHLPRVTTLPHGHTHIPAPRVTPSRFLSPISLVVTLRKCHSHNMI